MLNCRACCRYQFQCCGRRGWFARLDMQDQTVHQTDDVITKLAVGGARFEPAKEGLEGYLEGRNRLATS